jgi:F-type H+-transporting ATPase subunit a
MTAARRPVNVMKERISTMSKMLESLRKVLWSTPMRKGWTIVVVVLLLASVLTRFVAPVPPPHVSLAGEPIFSNGPAWLTNSILMTMIVDVILIILALATRFSLKELPGGFQNAMEAIVEALYGLTESVAGNNAAKFFPWAATLFLLIIVSNWSGLIPGVGSIGIYQPVEVHSEEPAANEGSGAYAGTATAVPGTGESQSDRRLAHQLAMADGKLILVSLEDVQAAPSAGFVGAPAAAEEEGEKFVPLLRAPSADLNLTFALAIATMVMVQIWGVRFLGGSYFRKFWNFTGPNGFMKGISLFAGILELVSEFARIIAFGFRLFGNIFAGEIVLATMAFLIAFLIPVPFYMLEVLVGAVQALVFMMLALVFFQLASVSHSGHDEHH